MVPVRRATSWGVANSLLLLSMSAAARLLLVEVIDATDAQSIAVEVDKLEMSSTVSC